MAGQGVGIASSRGKEGSRGRLVRGGVKYEDYGVREESIMIAGNTSYLPTGALTVSKNNLRARNMVTVIFKDKARGSGRSQQQKTG